MTINRNLRILAAVIAVVLYANLASFTTKSSGYAQSYPAVVCTPSTSGLSSYISLTSSTTQVRKTGTSTMAFTGARTSRIVTSSQSYIIDSAERTPISWQVRSGTWAGATTCMAPVTSQWFVGGTADVTSKGILYLVNSGLGKALVGVTIVTENGTQSEQSFLVRANSYSSISLSSLSPGAKSLAIHVVPQTGRINAFMVDERGRGLRALGGDTVNSLEAPSKVLHIPAIPHVTKNKKGLSHSLRLVIPGEVGSQISAVITSTDGTYSPADIDGRFIPAGKVVEIPMNLQMPTGKLSLTISSERPLVASVISQTNSGGKSDFVWSTPVTALEPSSFSITGLAPLLLFSGEKISVDLEIFFPKGKVVKATVRGEGISSYQVGEKARTVVIKKSSEDVYGGALISSQSGYGFAPLIAGSRLTRSSLPQSNIRVLIP